MINDHENLIKDSPLVILDANYSQEAIDAVLKLCCLHEVPVFFEPTDPKKSAKAMASPFVKAIKYASPNIHELRYMAHAHSGLKNPKKRSNLLENRSENFCLTILSHKIVLLD